MSELAAHQVDSRVRQFKQWPVLFIRNPAAWARLPVARADSLRRLVPAGIRIEPSLTPVERAREVFKAMLLSLFVQEVKAGEPDPRLLKGLYLFWHSFLQSVDPGHAVASLLKVIRYCSDLDHASDFLLAVQAYVNEVYRRDVETGRKLLAVINDDSFRERLVAGLSANPTDSERRTFGNYLNHAALQLAIRIQAAVPDAFEPLPSSENAKAASTLPVQGQAPLPSSENAESASPLPSKAEVPLPSQEMANRSRQSSAAVLEAVQRAMIGLSTSPRREWRDRFPHLEYLERPLKVRGLRGHVASPRFDIKTDGWPTTSGVLSGMLGSGRTTVMQHLMEEADPSLASDPQVPLVVHLSALDLVVYARNRRSLYDFICDQNLLDERTPRGRSTRNELMARDTAGQLLVLVDDLNILSERDQQDVIDHLAFSPRVIFATVPWQVERVAQRMRQDRLVEYEIPDLTPAQQWDMYSAYTRYERPDFDREPGWAEVMKYPDLAKLPLGIVTIYNSLFHTTRTDLPQTALFEWLKRTALVDPRVNPWECLTSPLGELFVRAAKKRWEADLTATAPAPWNRDRLTITLEEFRNSSAASLGLTWEKLSSSGVFLPGSERGEPVLYLTNRDWTGYLIRHASRLQEQKLRARRALHRKPPAGWVQRLGRGLKGLIDIDWPPDHDTA